MTDKIELTLEECTTLVNLLMFQYISYENIKALELMRKLRKHVETYETSKQSS
jgi:hypothetical protein